MEEEELVRGAQAISLALKVVAGLAVAAAGWWLIREFLR